MIRSLCLASIAVLALAACQKDEPAAAPEAPAPAVAPAAPAPAADPNQLTAEGLGPVKIGMTAAEVASAWGPDSNPAAVGGAEPAMCDEYHPSRAPEGVNVMIQEGRLARISLINAATIKTDRGFGLGDTGLAIKQAYGGAIIAQPAKYEAAPAEDLFSWAHGGSTSYVQDPTARGVRYEIDGDGKVSRIHAGDPAIQLVEGCS
ncbi:hypothetical protein BH09PSE1_BH09PSE1_22160 [soil metagenome]